jgi:myosin protein heavy chain
VDGWIDKNKDPLNDNVIELLQKSTNAFIVDLWTERKTLLGSLSSFIDYTVEIIIIIHLLS